MRAADKQPALLWSGHEGTRCHGQPPLLMNATLPAAAVRLEVLVLARDIGLDHPHAVRLPDSEGLLVCSTTITPDKELVCHLNALPCSQYSRGKGATQEPHTHGAREPAGQGKKGNAGGRACRGAQSWDHKRNVCHDPSRGEVSSFRPSASSHGSQEYFCGGHDGGHLHGALPPRDLGRGRTFGLAPAGVRAQGGTARCQARGGQRVGSPVPPLPHTRMIQEYAYDNTPSARALVS